jgi:hypothetical protein
VQFGPRDVGRPALILDHFLGLMLCCCCKKLILCCALVAARAAFTVRQAGLKHESAVLPWLAARLQPAPAASECTMACRLCLAPSTQPKPPLHPTLF